jgi:hypothetical protein
MGPSFEMLLDQELSFVFDSCLGQLCELRVPWLLVMFEEYFLFLLAVHLSWVSYVEMAH